MIFIYAHCIWPRFADRAFYDVYLRLAFSFCFFVFLKDAGARLLRRLQKEALLSPEPGTSRPPPAAALFNESSNATAAETDLRRRSGVKFPPRFGPIKTRRTVPSAKHRQITSSPATAATAVAASAVVAPTQEPIFLNGGTGARDYVRHSPILHL